MSRQSPQMQILSRALQACGGEVPLAKALGVPAQALGRWLTGHDPLPASVYLRASALVAPPGQRA
jgi:hypothetical protein